MLQFSLDIKRKLEFGNLFALDSCREFKQTKKLACKGVASAKQYFPTKGYFNLKSLLGSAKYVTRSSLQRGLQCGSNSHLPEPSKREGRAVHKREGSSSTHSPVAVIQRM